MVSNIYEGVASGELRLICLGLGVRRDASYDWWFFWERHWWVFPVGVRPIYEVYSKAIDEVAGLCYVGLVLRPVLVSELTSTGCIS